MSPNRGGDDVIKQYNPLLPTKSGRMKQVASTALLIIHNLAIYQIWVS